VDGGEIVAREGEREGADMVLKFLGKGIGQAREPAILHAD
jgi:hypothetical protein